MKSFLRIFAVHHGEHVLFFVSLAVFILMNSVFIYAHCPAFLQANHGHIGAFSLFANKLGLTGYDPYVYMSMTQFTTRYEINRHPLVTLFIYPFYLLNHWVMTTFDINIAIFIMGIFVVLASTYSALFLFRTLKDVMELRKSDAFVLTALLFSFASIMTSSISPDLFIFSLFWLTMTMYLFGRSIKEKRPMEWYKVATLYLLTAGTTLTNGLKTLIGYIFTNHKAAFRGRNILLVLVVPTAILVACGAFQYETLYKVKKQNDKHIWVANQKKNPEESAYQDSLARVRRNAINGTDHSDIPFLNLINTEVDHVGCTVEWFFGESIQMHQDYLLMDVFNGRPMMVHYRNAWFYVVEGVVVAFFFIGIWVGRRKRLIQMLLSWFAVDVLIHIVLGFGLNEANINGCHWMFFIPVAYACLYQSMPRKILPIFRFFILILTCYLWGYNGSLLLHHVLG